MNTSFHLIEFSKLLEEIPNIESIYFFFFNTSLIFILTIYLSKCKKLNFIKKSSTIVLDKYLDKGSDEFLLLSSNKLSSEELMGLYNYTIEEVTPSGLVKLSYDNTYEAFVYYSDEEIPYKYLEVVARLFVIEYNCKSLYIDYKQELFKARNVFFDKKNTPDNTRVNSIYAISKNKKLPENTNFYIVPEVSNKYIKKGKIKDLLEETKIKERQEMKNKIIKEINFKDFKNFKI